MFRHVRLKKTALLLLALTPSFVVAADDNIQPPSLLGVWYGTYDDSSDADPASAEMWMGVYWQLSEDGWDVRGHNRWHVLAEPEAETFGGSSLGKQAEHFDSFSGSIARDRQHVILNEDGRGSRIEAALLSDDSMKARFFQKAQSTPAFEVTLTRINTHYKPSDRAVLGLDVSHHSGDVDWPKVKAQGYRFAYVKASEGVDNPDAMFEHHWAGLKAAGLARGAYHFYVTEDDPVQQAKFFASRIKDDPGTLPPAVDVELLGHNTHGDMTDELLLFLKTLEAELGVKPMIYTDATFWDKYYRPDFSAYPLWMVEYGVKMPKVPFGWENWLFWQHAADRHVDGVEKTADISFAHPSIDFEKLEPTAGSADH